MEFIQLKKILNSNPNLIKGHLLLALIYMKKGSYERAKKPINKVLRIDTNNPLAKKYLAELKKTENAPVKIVKNSASQGGIRDYEMEQINREIKNGYDIVVHCKSGLSSKGIWAANAPVDAGYKGEIHAILYNTSTEKISIKAGEKVGQLVVRPVIYADFVTELGNERGSGAFGSTGK